MVNVSFTFLLENLYDQDFISESRKDWELSAKRTSGGRYKISTGNWGITQEAHYVPRSGFNAVSSETGHLYVRTLEEPSIGTSSPQTPLDLTLK